MQRRVESIHVADLPLHNHKNVLSVSVGYDQRRKRIELRIIPLERTPGSSLVMMSIFGGPRSAYEYLADCGRYSLPKIEEYARAIECVVKGGTAADKPGLTGTYQAALSGVLTANGYILADDEHPVYKPVTFEVGARVLVETQRGKSYGWVVDKMIGGRGKEVYEVIKDAGEDGQLGYAGHVEPDGEYQKMTASGLLSDAAIADAAFIEDLKARYYAQVAEREAAAEREKAARESEYETELASLRAEYPWAKQDGRSYARAAWNLKVELQTKFPGVQFSVTSKSYSGGDSIDVEWTNGPTIEQVEKISEKYQYHSHMDQSDYVHTKSGPRHKAVDAWLGTAKYVSERRNYSPDARAAVEAAVTAEMGGEDVIRGLSYNNPNFPDKVLSRSEIYGTFERVEEGEDHYLVAIFSRPSAPAAGATFGRHYPSEATGSADGITVRENAEKAGIEVKFAAKPDLGVITALKSHGFRWSKFQKLWYAKASDRTRTFAYGLVGGISEAQSLQAAA